MSRDAVILPDYCKMSEFSGSSLGMTDFSAVFLRSKETRFGDSRQLLS